MWSHARFLDMSTSAFKYYLQNAKLNWECNWCSLPFNELSVGELVLELETENIISRQESDTELGINANQGFINPFDNLNTKSIIDERQTDSSEALIVHLNINTIQNKFEELKTLNEKIKAHVIAIYGTKIDSFYPSKQFPIEGYNIYRRDRKKGGGGLIVYFSMCLPSQKIALPKVFKTFEAIAVETRIGTNDIIFLVMYRPPKQTSKRNDKQFKYYETIEQEINDIVM
jgi:hypothetical protein